MKKKVLTFIALLICAIPLFSQYNIKLTVNGLSKDTLLFGHYFNETIMLKDSFFLDDKGLATIKGSENLPKGMYTIFFSDQRRFDLIIDDDQEFEITADYADLVNSTRIKSSEENQIFYEYLVHINKKRGEAERIQGRINDPQSREDSLAARKELTELNAEVKNFAENIINQNSGLFVAKFLLGMKEVEVPDPPRDENGVITDSSFQVNYFKKHYWDYFDLSDVRMLRTPLYEKKLRTYLDRWIYPDPDSVNSEVDWLIEQSRSDTLLFKYMLTTLFNYYAKSKYIGMDAVYAYIAEKYFIPEASWSDEEFIEKLKERVSKINPLIIGKKAPDIRLVSISDDHFMAARADTSVKRNPYVGSFFNLSNLEGRYTILYFWESDCGHCKTTIPQLHQLFDKYKNEGLNVVAVSLLGGVEGKEKWVDFINEYALYGWINAWNPYDFSYRDSYDVNSSNIMYLLDGDMKILAKKIGPEQAESIIENEMKKENNN